ncbi:MAG: polysaccharide biosynthesis/export family protein [Hyphomicrobiaceae bacterium]
MIRFDSLSRFLSMRIAQPCNGSDRRPFKSGESDRIALQCFRLVATFALMMAACPGLLKHDAKAADSNSRPAEAAMGYKLGPLDKVRVQIFEWRPSRDEVYNWSPLNAEYTIGANGMLAFPLLGEIGSGGLTPAQLAKTISNRLRDRMGLALSPDTTVEVTKYRPFYIVGEVERPGAYPYRPGLTVLQAVSIAGGLIKKRQIAGLRLERELISTRGRMRLINREIKILLARRARLMAELKGASQIIFPATSTGAPEIVEQEQLIFRARHKAHETQITALGQLKDFLAKDVVSLTAQLKNHKEEAELLKAELKNMRALAKKGLVSSPRKLAVERNVMQMRSSGLRLDSRLSRAKQEISRTEIVILELQNKRKNEVTVKLQATQIKLGELQQQLKTSDQLLYETEVVAPRLLFKGSRRSQAKPSFKIVRWSASGQVEFSATEGADIKPGDTLKIEFPRQARMASHVSHAGHQLRYEQVFQNSPLRSPLGNVEQ